MNNMSEKKNIGEKGAIFMIPIGQSHIGSEKPKPCVILPANKAIALYKELTEGDIAYTLRHDYLVLIRDAKSVDE